MSLYDSVADLPLTIEDYSLELLTRTVSSGFERVTTTIVLRGGGHEGRGEDVTYEAEAHTGEIDVPLEGEFTFDAFSEHLGALDLFPGFEPQQPVYRRYRRWGFESAALDLALRQAGTSLHATLARDPQPVTFVVSSRMGDPPTLEPVTRRLAPYPGTRQLLPRHRMGPPPHARAGDPQARPLPEHPLQARRDARLERRADQGPAGHRGGRQHRFQGRLQGHARRRGDRPGLLPQDRRGVPRRLARGPRPRRQRRLPRARALPGPDHLGRADPRRRRHPRPQGDPAHGQPQAVALRQPQVAVRWL